MNEYGPAASQPPRSGRAPRLSPDEFAHQYQDAFRVLWCIAVSVVGNRAAADDVLQDAAMIALGKLDEFDASTNFSAWFGRIIRFVGLNHRRKQARQGPTFDPADLNSLRSPAPHAAPAIHDNGSLAPDQPHFDDRVAAAVQSLDETARTCLLLRTILDLPYRQISLALDIPEGTAMSHVHRSRAHLRQLLSSSHASKTDLGGHTS